MTKKLNDIPSGVTADELVEGLAAPKQPMDIAIDTDDLDLDDDLDDDIDGSEPSGPGKPAEQTSIMHNHKNARDNAELIVFLITLIVAFVLAKLVDIDGDMKEYEFDPEQQRKIEKGFEIWFNSFENDFKLPVFLAWVAPLGMAIYDKTDQALDNRKKKKAALKPVFEAPIRRHPASDGVTVAANRQFTQNPPLNVNESDKPKAKPPEKPTETKAKDQPGDDKIDSGISENISSVPGADGNDSEVKAKPAKTPKKSGKGRASKKPTDKK